MTPELPLPLVLVLKESGPTATEKQTCASFSQHTVEPSAASPPWLVAGRDPLGQEHEEAGMQVVGTHPASVPSAAVSHEAPQISAATGGQLPTLLGPHS